MTTPARIQNLRAVPDDGQITISWDEYPGAMAYSVAYHYLDPVEINITLLGHARNPLIQRGLDNGRRYFYEVFAFDSTSASVIFNPSLAIAEGSVIATPNGPVPTYLDGPTDISLLGRTVSWTNPTPPRGVSVRSTQVFVYYFGRTAGTGSYDSTGFGITGTSKEISTSRNVDLTRPIYLRTSYSDSSRSDFIRFDPPQEIYAVPARISGFEEIYQLNASIDAPFREIYAVPAIQTGFEEIYAVDAEIGAQFREIYAVDANLAGFSEIYAVPAGITAFREIYAVPAMQVGFEEIYTVPAGVSAFVEVYAVPASLTGFEEIYAVDAEIGATFKEIYRVPAILDAFREIYAVPADLGQSEEIYTVPASITGFTEIYRVDVQIGFKEIYQTRVNMEQRWEYRPYNTEDWIDITDIARQGVFRRGRNPSTLGGGSPRTRAGSVDVALSGIFPKPGDQLRLYYGLGFPRLRFWGTLASVDTDVRNRVLTSWRGAAWALTADTDISDPLLIDVTCAGILALFGRIYDVETTTLGTLDTQFTRQMPLGSTGMLTLEELSGGFTRELYSLSEGPRVALEFPSYRNDAPVARRLSDQVLMPGERSIPRPRYHENAFGVINHLNLGYNRHTPINQEEGITSYDYTIRIPRSSIILGSPTIGKTVLTEVVEEIIVFPRDVGITFELEFSYQGTTIATVTQLLGGGGGPTTIDGVTVTILITEVRLFLNGGLLLIDFKYSAVSRDADFNPVDIAIDLSGGVTITGSPRQLLRQTRSFSYQVDDPVSIQRYKRRSLRPRPIIADARILASSPNYRPNSREEEMLVRSAREILANRHGPVPIVETEIGDLLLIDEQEISDREHLRLADVEGDYHIESLETRIGYPWLQRAWLAPRELAIGRPQII